MATLLTDAAALVDTSAAWCVGANARNAEGIWVPAGHSTAVAWDIYGSLMKAQAEGSYSVADFQEAYAHTRGKIPSDFGDGNQDIEYYNDSLEFGDVAAIFS